jgi:sulfoxide reductase heme-binding subunit YedZ
MNGALDPARYGWWLASRAAGIVAILLLTGAVMIGLLLAARVLRPGSLKRRLVSVHEQLALVGLVATAVHGLTLLGDSWLHPGIAGIAIPFRLPYRTLFTGLGVLAGYFAGVLGLTFYVRRRLGARRWRALHRTAPLVWGLAVVHVLGAGTDASSAWLRTPVLASVALVSVLLALRLRPGAGRRRSRRRSSPELASPAARAR